MAKSFMQIVESIVLAQQNVAAGNSLWQCNAIIGWHEFASECKKTFEELWSRIESSEDEYVSDAQAISQLVTLSRFMGAAKAVTLTPVESDDDRFRENEEMETFKKLVSADS